MKLSQIVAFVSDPSKFQFTYKGRKVEFLNEARRIDDNSVFYVAGNEFGAEYLIHVDPGYRGDGFEAAWSEFIDAQPTIPNEDLITALRPEGDNDSFEDLARTELEGEKPAHYWSGEYDDWHAKVVARAKELLAACECPDVVEGYEYNSNGGIVDVGHYAWLNEANLDEVEIAPKDAAAEDAA